MERPKVGVGSLDSVVPDVFDQGLFLGGQEAIFLSFFVRGEDVLLDFEVVVGLLEFGEYLKPDDSFHFPLEREVKELTNFRIN